MREHEQTIKQHIRDMNTAWMEGRIDDLGDFFDRHVVFAPPAGGNRIVGRENALESFRQYMEHARTHEFEEKSLVVDIVGSVAVATLEFRVRYEYSGDMHEEQGRDILVLCQAAQGWRIVWRTQFTQDAG